MRRTQTIFKSERRATKSLLIFAMMIIGVWSGKGLAAEAEKPYAGIEQTQPATGPFVKIDGGFMVPYKKTIPGTEVVFEMIPVPGGNFKMGSPDAEKGRNKNEGPQFEVTVEPFWIGKYEITWAEYKQFMALYHVFKHLERTGSRAVTKDNDADAVTAPSALYDPTYTFEKGDKPQLPAVSMSQYAAKQYTKWLSRLTGEFYRLPWEVEWEYACRAGSTTAYSFGDDVKKLDEYAWTAANSDDKPHLVGLKKPNAWGLYDMHGNVAEWCLDELIDDSYQKHAGKSVAAADTAVWPKKLYPRVIRGGSWDDKPEFARSAARTGSDDKLWLDNDADAPPSPWWFTDGMALSAGMRIIRPLKAPPTAKCNTYWEPDINSLRDNLKIRTEMGRAVRGLVDKELPEAIKKFEASEKRDAGQK